MKRSSRWFILAVLAACVLSACAPVETSCSRSSDRGGSRRWRYLDAPGRSDGNGLRPGRGIPDG